MTSISTLGVRFATATFAAVALSSGAALAAGYPEKPIEVVTHAGAGGGTDVTTRMMIIQTNRAIGEEMVVVNKRGGGGAVAMNYVMERPADGYTVLALTIGHIAQIAAGKTTMTMADIVPLARATDDPQLMMAKCNNGKFKTSEEYIAYAKANSASYGTVGVGSIDDISTYVLSKKAGLKKPKIVPFKGGGEIATNVVAGNIDIGVLNLSETEAQIKAGEICPMLVLGTKRMAPIPNVPTARDLGYDVTFSTVRGFAVKKGVPDDIVKKLEAAMLKGMSDSVYGAYLTTSGLDGDSIVGAAEWGKQVQQMHDEMKAVMIELGMVKG